MYAFYQIFGLFVEIVIKIGIMMFNKNSVIKPNPYGKLSLDKLEEFEKEIGVKLPDEYRKYLIQYNGAKFENNTFSLNWDKGNKSTIHSMYGIANKPKWFSIREQNPYLYDINVVKKGYLSIGSDGLGNQILIKLKWPNKGAIYFWDHEKPFLRFKNVLLKQADSFIEFVDNLKKEETYEEFMKRMSVENPVMYKRLKELE